MDSYSNNRKSVFDISKFKPKTPVHSSGSSGLTDITCHIADARNIMVQLKQHGLSSGTSLGWHSGLCDHAAEVIEALVCDLNNAQTILGAYEQVRWERDIAIRQLRDDYGVNLGEKKPDDGSFAVGGDDQDQLGFMENPV